MRLIEKVIPSPFLTNAPSHPVYSGTVAFLRFSSPVTAAGPLLILTGFP